jgi:transposase
MAGESCRAVAARFRVSVASVVKWSQRYRATGSAAAKRMGGYRPLALAGERDWLLARIAARPDVTLRALVAELAERGIAVSYFAVWPFYEHQGISFKKSLHASEQDRPDVARRRARWKTYQGRLDPKQLTLGHCLVGFGFMLLGRSELIGLAQLSASRARAAIDKRGSTPREEHLVDALDAWIGAPDATCSASQRTACLPIEAIRESGGRAAAFPRRRLRV